MPSVLSKFDAAARALKAENDAMTQYADASARVANANRRQNAVHALIQEGLANGGLVQLEEFEDPVEDPEFNRMQAEMQTAIALLNAPQNLPGAQTPPQTPPQTQLIPRLIGAARASANGPSLDWDADTDLRSIAAEIAERDTVKKLAERCVEHAAKIIDLQRQLATAHTQRDRALAAASSDRRELNAMRTELHRTQEVLAKKSRQADRDKRAKTEAETNLKAVRKDLHKARETINSQQKTIDSVQQELYALKTKRLLAPRAQECVICMERPPMHAMTGCGHLCFCDTCLPTQKEQWNVAAKKKEPPSCPVCRKPFGRNKAQPVMKVYEGVDDDDNTQESGLDAWTFWCLYEQ